MIEIKVKGNWSKTDLFLERALNLVKLGVFDKYGAIGVDALRKATPKDSEKTANSWYYEIVRKRDSVSVQWLNSNLNQGIPIAILIQYGHGMRQGGYVQGIDYINPAVKPVFTEMADNLWKELTNG